MCCLLSMHFLRLSGVPNGHDLLESEGKVLENIYFYDCKHYLHCYMVCLTIIHNKYLLIMNKSTQKFYSLFTVRTL
jgi:hypothetical protein